MRLLDLFCGAGGAAVGYHRAGFTEIVGVDHWPQPRYPFEFVQADALDALERMCRVGWYIESARTDRIWFCNDFDAIHVSPPCQRYTVGRKIHNSGDRHPDLVDQCRELLERAGKPWVMENVMGSPLRTHAVLCGLMFGLKVFRHRLFEASFLLFVPEHPKHPAGDNTGASDGYSTGANGFVCVAGNNFVRTAGAEAMGIDWMKTRKELAQAIPPAYTEFIGRQLIHAITNEAASAATDPQPKD